MHAAWCALRRLVVAVVGCTTPTLQNKLAPTPSLGDTTPYHGNTRYKVEEKLESRHVPSKVAWSSVWMDGGDGKRRKECLERDEPRPLGVYPDGEGGGVDRSSPLIGHNVHPRTDLASLHLISVPW
eukprot:scaffold431_cov334-Pavlova_lutheri.AAC.55